jgi:hypothetical protein
MPKESTVCKENCYETVDLSAHANATGIGPVKRGRRGVVPYNRRGCQMSSRVHPWRGTWQ